MATAELSMGKLAEMGKPFDGNGPVDISRPPLPGKNRYQKRIDKFVKTIKNQAETIKRLEREKVALKAALAKSDGGLRRALELVEYYETTRAVTPNLNRYSLKGAQKNG